MEIPVTSARAIFDRAVFGVALLRPAGDRQFLNDRFCEIVNRSRQELLAS
jgi:PAS domain-containing protein